MNNNKKEFTMRVLERTTELLTNNPRMDSQLAAYQASQELTNYAVAVPKTTLTVYRNTESRAKEAARLLTIGGREPVVTAPEFSPEVLQ